MGREFTLALARHILTGVGSVLVARGVVDSGTVEAIAGGVLAIIGLAWSYKDKAERA